MRAFTRAIERAPPNEIIQGAMRYAAEREGEDQRYTENPATWLIKNCWTDQRPTSRARQGTALSNIAILIVRSSRNCTTTTISTKL